MADVLVFSPHPDDAELGMGGTIAKLIAAGWTVAIVDVTTGEPTPHGSEPTRAAETAVANAALGGPVRENLRLPNRWLEATVENRKLLAGVIRRHRPKLLFAPHAQDAHPDHLALHELAMRARFDAKLTKCDIPGSPHYVRRIVHFFCSHLRAHVQPTFLVDITDSVQAKRDAMAAYQSQFYLNRDRPGEIPEMVMA
ncbi:MAG: PIG-L family deacetylase, partial [Planctomycetes bacterium]|nr:PIG-L family deacetylase [Planctomycetota bacterium]